MTSLLRSVSAGYVRQRTGSSLVQVMAWRLLGWTNADLSRNKPSVHRPNNGDPLPSGTGSQLLCLIIWWCHQWKHFPRYWPFVWGIHWSPVNSPHKGQWRGALMFLWSTPWINGWVNNCEADDLRRHRTHYDVIVMSSMKFYPKLIHYHSPNFIGKCVVC